MPYCHSDGICSSSQNQNPTLWRRTPPRAPLPPGTTEAQCLRRATDLTFNRISVDGDTSTNDTVFVLASGAAGAAPVAVRLGALMVGEPGALAAGSAF